MLSAVALPYFLLITLLIVSSFAENSKEDELTHYTLIYEKFTTDWSRPWLDHVLSFVPHNTITMSRSEIHSSCETENFPVKPILVLAKVDDVEIPPLQACGRIRPTGLVVFDEQQALDSSVYSLFLFTLRFFGEYTVRLSNDGDSLPGGSNKFSKTRSDVFVLPLGVSKG